MFGGFFIWKGQVNDACGKILVDHVTLPRENTHREGVQSGLCASQLMQITGVKVHLASL